MFLRGSSYLDDLKENCDWIMNEFETRKKQRKDELAGLPWRAECRKAQRRWTDEPLLTSSQYGSLYFIEFKNIVEFAPITFYPVPVEGQPVIRPCFGKAERLCVAS